MTMSVLYQADAVPDEVERAAAPALIGGLSSSDDGGVDLVLSRVGDVQVPYVIPAQDPADPPVDGGECEVRTLVEGTDPALPAVWATPPIDLELDLGARLRTDQILDRLAVGRVVRSSNLWIASDGNVTPVHFDRSHGVLYQLAGEKHVWLRPLKARGGPARAGMWSPTANFSPSPDHLSAHVTQDPEIVHLTLTPGHALYIPPYWWHQVRSSSVTVSMNVWWEATPRTLARASASQLARDTLRTWRRRLG